MLTLLGALTLLLLLASPVNALDIDKHSVEGQVHAIQSVHVAEGAYAAALIVQPGFQEAPQSWLLIAPDTDPQNWTFVEVQGSPGEIAVGDVTGDGHDEVALSHRLEGHACPGPGPVQEIPCGIVRIYDAQALHEGQLDAITEVRIQPDEHACPPSNYPPTKLHLEDVTGDGHADLAMGQTGSHEGTCGVARVILGAHLANADTATSHDACAITRGSPTVQGEQPDMYATELILFTPGNDPTHGRLAVGAPQATVDGQQNVGEVTMYDISEHCSGDQATKNPPALKTIQGDERNGVFSYSLAHHHDTLWVSSSTQGPLAMFNATTLEEEDPLPIAPNRPLQVTKDMTGDGNPQIWSGPYVHNLDGTMAYHFQPFAHDNFRAAPITSDQVLASDKFGQRLWSISDLDHPHLVLYASEPDDLDNVQPHDTVNVTVAQMISTIPDPFPLQWHATGATVEDYTDTWVHLVPEEPGTITVQATLHNATATYRIPVQAAPGTFNVEGPNNVLPMHPLTLEATAPPNATITWESPQATNTTGEGSTFQTSYEAPGDYVITANITHPDEPDPVFITHNVTVEEATLTIQAPQAIPQGERLNLNVQDAPENATLQWRLDHGEMGVLHIEGTGVHVPTSGAGPLNVTVTATSNEGEHLGSGHASVLIENRAPRVVSFSIDTATTAQLAGQIVAEDPGGDAIEILWLLDGEPVDEGTRLSVSSLEEGRANVTVIVTDEEGLSTPRTRPVTIENPFTIEHQDSNEQESETSTSPQGQDENILPTPTPALALALALVTLSAKLTAPKRPG